MHLGPMMNLEGGKALHSEHVQANKQTNKHNRFP